MSGVGGILPKERMLAALMCRHADRVPAGELASFWDITDRAIGRPTYYRSKWREWVAVREGRRDDIAYSYGRDIVDLARRFECDYLVVPLVPARMEEYKRLQLLEDVAAVLFSEKQVTQ